MAEDQDQRTEQASEKRLSEAADRGQVAYSNELTQAILLLSGLTLVSMMGVPLIASLQETMRDSLGKFPRGELDLNTIAAHLLSIVRRTMPAFLPLAGGMLLIAAVASYLQTGLHFRSQVLKFELDRLNPLNGAAKLFSPRSLVQLLSALIKLAIILGIVYSSSANLIEQILVLGRAPIRASFSTGASMALSLLLRIGLATLLVGGADYLYQRWQHARDLRMTKQEVRDEHKESQGDPEVRGRIKRAQREAARARMLKAVPTASVVVTNPTHFAVALRYRRPGGLEPADEAPIVVAKGADLFAKRIREIATESGVPIVENPPLARSLYKSADVGMTIPVELYRAVAEVLAFVFKLKGPSRR